MSSFAYMLSAFFALIVSPFLLRGKMSVPLRAAFWTMVLLAYELFTWLSAETYALEEMLPFLMFALSLCFAAMQLPHRRRFFETLATVLWCWVYFFGMLSLSYRGEEFRLMPLGAIALSFLPIFGLNPGKRESQFVVAVVWLVAWMLSFAGGV